MAAPEIVGVDPQDEAALRSWYDLEAASIRHDRPEPVHRTFASPAAMVRDPHPRRREGIGTSLHAEVDRKRRAEERLRLSEERMTRSFRRLVAAARHRASGELVAYTLVMPAHRGHGLGRLLERASLGRLQREHPERRLMHTWTDPDNGAMGVTNRRSGYRSVEVMDELRRVDPG